MFNNIKNDNDGAINGIKCIATNCVYNAAKKCTASEIEVGTSNASSVEETGCLTFNCRK